MLGLVSLGYMFSKKNGVQPLPSGPAPLAGPLPRVGNPALAMHRRNNPDVSVDMVRSAEMRAAQELERAPNFAQRQAGANPFAGALPAPSGGGGGYYSELAGVSMSPADFKHNNMQHFYGSSVRGMDSRGDNGALMEAFSGASGPGNSMRRREVQPMFRPEETMDRTAAGGGSQLLSGHPEIAERFGQSLSGTQAGRRPFDPVHVGPGLGQGYTAAPSGGFQQNNTLDFLRVKNVDELRTADKPKTSMEGRVVPGAGMPQRGQVGKLAHNRPSTAFDSSDRGLFGGKGLDRAAPAPDASSVLRKITLTPGHDDLRLGPGAAAAGGASAALSYPQQRAYEQRMASEAAPGLGGGISASRFGGAAPRVLAKRARGASGVEGFVDEGEEQGAAQGRDSPDIWSHFLGPATSAGAHLSAAQPMRASGREITEENTMMFGNMSLRAPPRPPAYDPDHMTTRTTLKETAIHDSRSGNLGAGFGGVAAGRANNSGEGFETEETRHTMREYAEGESYQHTVRNPRPTSLESAATEAGWRGDPTPTTMRETMGEARQNSGHAVMPGSVPGAYATNTVEAALTHRELTGQRPRAGAPANGGGRGEASGYVAQLDAMRGGKAAVDGGAMTASGLRGDRDFDYYGIPKADVTGGVDYTQLYTATLNEAKQDLLRSRAPGGHAPGGKTAARAEHMGKGQLRADPAPASRLEAPNLRSNARVDTGGSTVRSDRNENRRLADHKVLTSYVDDNPYVPTGVWNAK